MLKRTDFKIPKKIVIAFTLIVIIFLFSGVIWFMICVKKTDALVLADDLTCNFREVVYADRFIKELDGTLLDQYLVDTSEVGKKRIEVQYKNRYGFVEYKRFEIEVKDITPPIVVIQNPYTVIVGEVTRLEDTIFCADDYDDDVICDIQGEYDLNKVGKYSLRMVAKDGSGNETTKDFLLNVVDKPKNSSSNEQTSSEYTSFREVYQKHKSDKTMIGLDISKWQGEVDYGKLKEQGVEFVMLKIGGQTKINGEFNVDPTFYQNIEQAIQHDLKVGVYFYSYAKTEAEAKKQARWIIQQLGNYKLSLPIAFDWENFSEYSTFHISFHTLNKIATAFIQEIKRYGYEGVLYSSKYYLENIWYSDDYTNWLAYYTNHNNYEGDYWMWQMCSDGKIEGIAGYVDIDVMYLK